MSDTKYIVFIITNGRPDSVITDKTLCRQGYTGPIVYVVDDEDKTLDQYKAKYGAAVEVFDKKRYADMTDEGDNFDNRRTTSHARNACFDIAERLGYEFFLVLDDDYYEFQYRTGRLGQYPSGHLTIKTTANAVVSALFEFYKKSPFATIALAQGGDFIGGAECSFAVEPTIRRKAMNSFFCSTRRRFQFVGRLNEDVNTVCLQGGRGVLFGTIPLVMLNQLDTQSQAGGMTDAYKASGTYVKSMYTVMMCPAFVKVYGLHTTHARLHHRIEWKNAVPVILSEEHASRKAKRGKR